jgi:hypothetical protein
MIQQKRKDNAPEWHNISAISKESSVDVHSPMIHPIQLSEQKTHNCWARGVTTLGAMLIFPVTFPLLLLFLPLVPPAAPVWIAILLLARMPSLILVSHISHMLFVLNLPDDEAFGSLIR